MVFTVIKAQITALKYWQQISVFFSPCIQQQTKLKTSLESHEFTANIVQDKVTAIYNKLLCHLNKKQPHTFFLFLIKHCHFTALQPP